MHVTGIRPAPATLHPSTKMAAGAEPRARRRLEQPALSAQARRPRPRAGTTSPRMLCGARPARADRTGREGSTVEPEFARRPASERANGRGHGAQRAGASLSATRRDYKSQDARRGAPRSVPSAKWRPGGLDWTGRRRRGTVHGVSYICTPAPSLSHIPGPKSNFST